MATAAAAGTPQTTALELLLPPLRRLDHILAQAVNAAEAAYGPKAAGDPYRGLYVSTEEAQRLAGRDPGAPLLAPAGPAAPDGESACETPWTRLRDRFALTAFDLDAMLVALACEVDLKYERLYAYLQDDVTKRRPSVDLILSLLCDSREKRFAERARFAPDAPLVRRRLLTLVPDPAQNQPPLLAHYVRLDDAVVRMLFGQGGLDGRLSQWARLVDPVTEKLNEGLSSDLARALESLAAEARAAGRPLRIYFEGPPAAGQTAAAAGVARAAASRLLVADLSRAAFAGVPELETTLALLFRDAALLDAVLYLENLDALRADDRAPIVEALLGYVADASEIVILSGERTWASLRAPGDAINVSFGGTPYATRRHCWDVGLRAEGIAMAPDDLDAIAERFRLTPEQIERSIAAAVSRARLRAAGATLPVPVTAADLYAAARAHSAGNLGALARKIDPLYRWDDIILPPDMVMQLREICSQAKHRNLVFASWGFDRKISLGKGLNVLFSGPPGTGKTMAAEIIANELELDLYKIDLSQIVSKYIGETEKNLNRIFHEARASNAIIFFDEADALFGKRSEVRDSHDRYANIEIAYLLQKMEEYEGISILATNLRQNLDQAFTRRLSFCVDFPFPDEANRLLIWKSIWPRETPLDDALDLPFMASQFKLAGGSVKNIALASAFLAAEDKGKVRTSHLLRATRREFQKMGKTLTRAEFGVYWGLLGETA